MARLRTETREEAVRFLRLSAGLHLHRIPRGGVSLGKPYMRWLLVTEPKVAFCKAHPERCLKIRLRKANDG